MKIKTSELIGPALDWAVAECLGVDYCDRDGIDGIGNEFEKTDFSTDGAQGGPIIEREKISTTYEAYEGNSAWLAGKFNGVVTVMSFVGPTALIAAMRCYVASKLGDEVEIPEELK